MKVTYLDNNATTCVDPLVLEEMLPYFSERYGNPSSIHTFGGMVGRALASARERVAALINADPTEILFTSCGTESNNTVIFSAANADPAKRHIITSQVEHPAVLNTVEYLERKGHPVTWLGVNKQGALNLEELRNSIRDDTALVATMHANNETGVIFPIEEIAAICAERDVPFFTDAVQSTGKLLIDVKKTPVSYLSLSGHKLHAPKGIGVLYLRRRAFFSMYLHGGHQERGRRAGTENTASIVGLGKACELAAKFMGEEQTVIRTLRDRLENGLIAAIPDAVVNGDRLNRLPNTTNISFKNAEGESILLMLDHLGICASSGSACTSGSLEPSHVLRSMDVPFEYAHGSIRFSLSRFTMPEDIDLVLEHLPSIIERLRGMSPFGGQGL